MRILILLSLIASPAFAASVDPVNPESMCERFIKPDDQASCLKNAKSLDLDWYAASVCNMVDDDDQFTACWKKISGKGYSPASIAGCGADDMADEARVACLMKNSGAVVTTGKKENRSPASKAATAPPKYQPLKIKGR